MVIKKIAITLNLILISVLGFSQTKLPSMTVKDIDKSTAFQELIELLGDSDYFIQNVNKEVGFIQVKFIKEGKKGIFSKDSGNRIVYNILIRSSDSHAVRIGLQANVEKIVWDGEVYRSKDHYNDEGISNDPKDYEELLKLIESHFEHQ